MAILTAGLFYLGCGAANDEGGAYQEADSTGTKGELEDETRNDSDTGVPLSMDWAEMEMGAMDDAVSSEADVLNYGPDSPPDWDVDCNQPFHVGDLVITEVFSAPAGRHGSRQWIEIYNTTLEPVCIDSITVRSFGENPGVAHVHAKEKIILASRAYGAVGGSETRDFTVGQWENSLQLPADGGTIRIEQNGTIIDHVHVGVMKAESIPAPETGESVYLCNHCLDAGCNKIGANWNNVFACHPPKCIDMEPFEVSPFDDTGALGTPGKDNPDCVMN